jgi:predicted CoA-substrate-specific enzyme activase
MTTKKQPARRAKLFMGIDVGSVSVKMVLLDGPERIVEHYYVRHKGQPLETVRNILKEMSARHSLEDLAGLAVTGTGGQRAAKLLGGTFVNEIIAQTKAVGRFYPEARTVIEIGGEDSKLLMVRQDPRRGVMILEDFSMNTMCAAGTGSFLDQQASRLGLTIEEFARLSLKAQNPPRMAGRCSVFAKSDMIHLQQIGTPDYDIAAGLCFAMARSFKSNIGRGKVFTRPILFQGGVAANPGLVRAFEEILGLDSGELIIPEYHAHMSALGAVLIAMDGEIETGRFLGLKDLEANMKNVVAPVEEMTALELDYEVENEQRIAFRPVELKDGEEPEDVYLGVDVGSLSTNVVAIDRQHRVLARRYLRTAGRPIEAVRRGLQEIGQEIGDRVTVRGVGTTGSGRYLTGEFVGADVVRNEITAQATAAIDIDPTVDTVFEIGGQDSKYISIDHGTVVDFEMNKVCAAGTGSFLEEQAEKLGINIVEEFGNLALSSKTPGKFGDRCTVFMESDLVSHQQQGMPKEDLVAGLAYSIVYNYLNKVVEDRRVGDNIFFQGGTAWNQGVVAAFEKVTEKKITVPPHHDVTGAIGAAILALENDRGQGTRFKGFDLSQRTYTSSSFTCKGCANQCEIRKITFGEENPLFYGARCEKWERDDSGQQRGAGLPELFKEREAFWMEELRRRGLEEKTPQMSPERVIGIPRVLHFHELLPFWTAFFDELGFGVVLSEATNPRLIYRSVENVVAETCFPVKVIHGHILDLIDKGVRRIFLPSIINMPRAHPDHGENYYCPLSQGLPYIARSAISCDAQGAEFLEPYFHFQHEPKRLQREMIRFGKSLGVSPSQVKKALVAAWKAQHDFEQRCLRRGEEILAGLRGDPRAVVILSRPYNGCDAGLNLGLPKKLRDMGVLAIPQDFLDLDKSPAMPQLTGMYWKTGQRILAAAELVKEHHHLHAIFITNFKCGPDSFISHFLRHRMDTKPYLQLEVDEHSADAGVITRCEAFFDSLERKPAVRRRDEEESVESQSLGDHDLISEGQQLHAGRN